MVYHLIPVQRHHSVFRCHILGHLAGLRYRYRNSKFLQPHDHRQLCLIMTDQIRQCLSVHRRSVRKLLNIPFVRVSLNCHIMTRLRIQPQVLHLRVRYPGEQAGFHLRVSENHLRHPLSRALPQVVQDHRHDQAPTHRVSVWTVSPSTIISP